MNFYQHAGPMAIGSRLRHLTARLTEDATRVYELYDSPLDPRWFPVFYVLAAAGPKAVGELAEIIGHSHASVSQIVGGMTRRGLARAQRSETDGRLRLVELTEDGRQAAERMKGQISSVRESVEGILGEMKHDLWAALRELEERLEERSLYSRVRDEYRKQTAARVEISDFRPEDAADFERLNREWIEHYFGMEERDLLYIVDPIGQVIEPGGYILMARHEGETIGTVALIRRDAKTLELAKMAVTEAARGKGIGWLLGKAAVDRAREVGAQRIYLESNSKLQPAIHLYRKLGFQDFDGGESPYERADVQMEIWLR